MSIKGKPRIAATALIEKGGHVQSDLRAADEFVNICVRMNKKIVDDVDDLLKTSRPGLSRTAWIVEAMHEKLKRDQE